MSRVFRVYEQRGFAYRTHRRCLLLLLLLLLRWRRGADRLNRSRARRFEGRAIVFSSVRGPSDSYMTGRIKAIPHYVRSRERAMCPRGNACLLECAGMRGRRDTVRLRPVKLASSRVYAFMRSDRATRRLDSALRIKTNRLIRPFLGYAAIHVSFLPRNQTKSNE